MTVLILKMGELIQPINFTLKMYGEEALNAYPTVGISYGSTIKEDKDLIFSVKSGYLAIDDGQTKDYFSMVLEYRIISKQQRDELKDFYDANKYDYFYIQTNLDINRFKCHFTKPFRSTHEANLFNATSDIRGFIQNAA